MKPNLYSKPLLNRQRLRLAQEAARLMLQDGIDDYSAVKQKAARCLGLSPSHADVPENAEIDQAIREYQQIFSAKDQQQALLLRREIALEAMEFFESFSPRLTGAVLTGSISGDSSVILHVFPDTPEEVILKLIDSKIPFTEKSHEVMAENGRRQLLPRLMFQVDGIDVELLLFPSGYLKNQRKPNGLLAEKANIKQLRKLLA